MVRISVVLDIFTGSRVGQSAWGLEKVWVDNRLDAVLGEVAGNNLTTSRFNGLDSFFRGAGYSDINRCLQLFFSLIKASGLTRCNET